MSQRARNNPESYNWRLNQPRVPNVADDDAWCARLDMQECCRCHKNTSFKIGSDEALYREDGTGPYCDDCFEQEPVIEAIENAINQQPKDNNEHTKT